MVKPLQNQFIPNYVSPPGETLEDTLEAVGMSQAELAERTGLARKTVNLIVKGKASLTQDTALKLERVLGVPASFWSAREQQYQEMVARLEEQRRLKKYSQWLKQFPIGEMSKFKWVKSSQDKVKQIRELLNFFGVASPDEWQGIWIDNPKVTF
ncbi:MAG: HigA family addiction module antidote protein, partial [Candidatus Tectomicrobia bacterium]|nr:HigA family addiction module antidote protein [Candidatus Tectomicrobia bacterium]